MQTLRLSEVLAAMKRKYGSFDALAKEIAEGGGGATIDRRKLQKLAALEGMDLEREDFVRMKGDVNLRISELVALNKFLTPMGAGLATRPIFNQPTILATLAERPEVVFMFGAKPDEKRKNIEVSVWDVRCQAEILNSVNSYRANTRIKMEDVISRAPEKDGKEFGGWEKWFTDNHDASIVCIGSPRACRASEIMLAKMFGVKPFEDVKRAAETLPFHFIWARDTDPFGSRFAADAGSIERLDGALARAMRRDPKTAMGLLVNNTVLPAPYQGDRWIDYGIIAAQRRSSGGLWLALCGLSGPTTYAAAKAAKTLADIIPPAPVGEHSKVQWAVVKSVIDNNEMPGDSREVAGQEISGQPEVWIREVDATTRKVGQSYAPQFQGR